MTGSHDSEKAAKILGAAFDLFLEQGYEATGIRQICRVAGVELTTLYYHFNSKKGLFLWLADSLRETFRPDIPNNGHTGSAEDYLLDYFLFSMHYAMNHQKETRFYLRYSLFPPQELREEITLFLKNNQHTKNENILPCMNDCIRQGSVVLPLEKAMTAFWQFINGNTFNAVFSGWSPDDMEMIQLWQTFLHCRLSGRRLIEREVTE